MCGGEYSTKLASEFLIGGRNRRLGGVDDDIKSASCKKGPHRGAESALNGISYDSVFCY